MIKKIHHCLTPKTAVVKSYKQRLETLKAFNRVLFLCLPEEWRTYCQFVNLEGDVLTLSTASQELLTRLRFMQANILKQCQRRSALFTSISEIHCIFTAIPVYPPLYAREKPATAKAGNICNDAAEKCSAPVKRSLQKLAKRLLGRPSR